MPLPQKFSDIIFVMLDISTDKIQNCNCHKIFEDRYEIKHSSVDILHVQGFPLPFDYRRKMSVHVVLLKAASQFGDCKMRSSFSCL